MSWLSTFSIFEVSLIMNSTSSMVVGEGLVVDSGVLVDDSEILFEIQLAEKTTCIRIFG